MNIDFIPFQIGEQYENWEFDLEPVYDEITYDKYHYYKDDITSMLGIPVESIYLTFCLDILFNVEYHFKFKYFSLLVSTLIDNLSTGTYKTFGDRLEWENSRICVVVEKPTRTENVILKIIDKYYYQGF